MTTIEEFEEDLHARIEAVIEQRLSARFLGRPIDDEKTQKELVRFLADIGSRIYYHENFPSFLERCEDDPNRFIVHSPSYEEEPFDDETRKFFAQWIENLAVHLYRAEHGDSAADPHVTVHVDENDHTQFIVRFESIEHQ